MKNLKLTLGSVAMFFLSILAFAKPVQPHSTEWAGGFFVAKLVELKQEGVLNTYWTAVLSIGEFENTPDYTGFKWKVAVENDDFAYQLRKLEPYQTYVFEFKRNHPLINPIKHPFETPYRITSVQELNDYEASSFDTLNDNEPLSIEINEGPRASWKHGCKKGRITGVERWGKQRIICTIYFAVGGLSAIERQSSDAHTMFGVYSEEGCQFAEQTMRTAQDVSITYTEKFWPSYIDASKQIAHKIRVLTPHESSELRERAQALSSQE